MGGLLISPRNWGELILHIFPGVHRGCNPLGSHHLSVQLYTVLVQLPIPRGMRLIQGHTSQLYG